MSAGVKYVIPKIITVTKGTYLTRGATTSCGCVRGQNHCTHGESSSSTYKTWSAMKNRCFNPSHEEYHRYGGRGITVCERWLDFANFFADMGPRPPRMTLDRYPDLDGNYEPGNCRWATSKQQARNTTKNVWLIHNGETLCLKDAAEKCGIKRTTLAQRLRLGWSIERAVSTKAKGGVA